MKKIENQILKGQINFEKRWKRRGEELEKQNLDRYNNTKATELLNWFN